MSSTQYFLSSANANQKKNLLLHFAFKQHALYRFHSFLLSVMLKQRARGKGKKDNFPSLGNHFTFPYLNVPLLNMHCLRKEFVRNNILTTQVLK